MFPKLFFFNSLNNRKEVFEPIKKNQVNIYSCGPTIYDYSHIGNYRSFLFSDILHRFLKQIGFHVTLVMNLTDIDDKTIKGANQNHVSLKAFTSTYEKAFFEDLKQLKVIPATHYPRATDHIQEMVEMIKTLIEKKHAYEMNGSIYYKIDSFNQYGKLSKINLEQQRAGASERVDVDEYDKENVSDFVLWKNYQSEDGEIYYNTDLGKGRPGWHIECSAMSKKYLGKHFDIHTGGIDNRFPHHENEIAQSESVHQTNFVNLWMHVAHLLVEGEKMSKSLGNFYTLRDLLAKGIDALTIRYMLISSHYRHQYNFTDEGMVAAKKSLERIENFIEVLKRKKPSQANFHANQILDNTRKNFIANLCDDLNVSGALGIFYEYLNDIHKLFHSTNPQENQFSKEDLNKIKNFLKEVDGFLGIIPEKMIIETDISEEVLELLKKRNQARKDKDFSLADQLRKKIYEYNYEIVDSKEESSLKKI